MSVQRVQRLNRHAPAKAKLAFVEERAFSDALALRRYRLKNGLSILTMQDHSAPVVGYQTWYRIGSRDEVDGKTGLAHFFEHLMFNATSNFEQGEFDSRLEAAGAENNAATWVDWTQYYETLPKSELAVAIELEADRMVNLQLRKPQVESEREVVMSERRDRVDDDVEGKASELLSKLAYKEHGYRHPTIGWMEDIERYTMADCRSFYRRYYAPNNATVCVVGSFDEVELLGMMQERYGAHPASRLKGRAVRNEPEQRRERRAQVTLPTSTEKLLLGYKGPPLGHPDWRALSVLSDVLFGGRSARLYRQLVLDEELATEAYGSLAPFEEPGIYEIYLSAREGVSADTLLKKVDAGLRRVMKEKVDEAELEKSKARVELALLSSMESISGKAEQIGFDETVLGDPCASLGRVEAYRQLTQEDLLRAAQTYLKTRSRSRVRVLPGAQA